VIGVRDIVCNEYSSLIGFTPVFLLPHTIRREAPGRIHYTMVSIALYVS
jgi:hypothetical protein